MKTRLLLFFLLAFTFANAQINVVEGFESGAIPAGWTTESIDGVVTHSSSCGGTKSVRANYYTTTYAIIYTSSYVSNGEAINISFYTRKQIGAFFGYNYLYYEVNGSGSWNRIANVYSDFSTCTPVNATIAAGVIPSGSTVKFRMQVNSASSGNVNYVYFDNFSAVQQVSLPPQTIAEYNFDNTYNNVLGSAPFVSNTNTSFTTDRHSNPTGAINLTSIGNSLGTTATIPNLPYSNAPRTISLWVKLNNYDTGSFINPVFQYGTLSNDNMIGASVDDIYTTFYGYNNNLSVSTLNSLSTWYHYVFVYDGTTAKIYKDGAFLGSQARLWNTINDNNLFRIGASFAGAGSFTGAIDDLKIYNYALSPAEITSLHLNNNLSAKDFSTKKTKVALYPNPVKDILNIESETELKTVEIFNLQGQKVKTDNKRQINVSDLASGIYMVKIHNVNNEVVTKKIVKQ